MATQNVLLFGDQTTETLASIQNLARQSKKSPSLHRFLREATDFIQTHSAVLEPSERQRFYSFETLLDLAEEYAKQEIPDDLLATILSYVSRLGELLIYIDNDPKLFGTAEAPVHILGLCTGLLPAAALAGAKDINDLVKLGIEILALVFRLGLDLTRRSKQIESQPGCWGFVVTGTSAAHQQRLIDEFHTSQSIPAHRHAYISVVSTSWTTICGPPAILENLFASSPELGLAPKLRLPVGGAVHSAHLPRPDYNSIIGSSPAFNVSISAKTQLMSTSSCKPFESNDLKSLLFEMLEDISQNTLRLTAAVQALATSLPSKDNVRLVVVGPTSHMSLVHRGLEAHNNKVILVEQAELGSFENTLREGSKSIAIVGMSGRFPGGEGLDQFWETLQSGKDLHERIPKSRFDVDAYYDATGEGKNTMAAAHGCFIENPGHFDARLFNVSPREAAQMDPMQRLLLMSSYEALEMAGYTHGGSLSTGSKRIATYFGQAADDMKEINLQEGIDMYYVPGLARAFAPGRLNHHYKWEGASYSLDSACASSSTAVLLACDHLIARDCDTALAGGGSILNSPAIFSGLSKGGFLSTTGSCKTFREDADGYCRGEGVGVLVLKRLEDAIADNDNIHGVITAAARNYSAEASSITHPHSGTQERLYKRVLQQAAIDAQEISYVEMHGTATQAGDKSEMTSVSNVFGKDRTKENPLYVGAVKASVGHGEAAAGVTAMVKMVLMLKEGLITPQPGMSEPLNKNFPPLAKMNIHISDRKRVFKSTNADGKRKLMLNNFDAAGGNTSVLIEDPPALKEKEEDPRPYNVVTVSARTLFSFKENKQRLLNHLSLNEDYNLGDLAYTTTARRMHDIYRTSYTASSVEDIARLLKSDLATAAPVKKTPVRSPIVFTFTGQGSQYAGMGKDLFHTSPRFRSKILKLQTWCDWLGFPSFLDIIVNGEMSMKRKKPVQVQLAIVCLEIALAETWKSWGIMPDLVIGHSLGEYAALCVAGVLSVMDTLFLVGKRATLLAEKCEPGTYAMLAVVSDAAALQELLDAPEFESCEIACLNTATSTVVSGPVDTLKQLQTQLEEAEVKSTFLEVPFGFHSSQLDPILPDLEELAQKVHFATPVIPVASTLLGAVVTESDVFNAEYLVQQARECVNYSQALQACKEANFATEDTLWLEVGPNPVSNGLVKANLGVPTTKLMSTLKIGEDSWKLISKSIAAVYSAGKTINWPEYHKDYLNCLTLLELPTYAFDIKDYWTPFKQTLAPAQSQAVSAAPVAVSVPGFPTTTLQSVQTELLSDSKISVIFSSHTAEPKMFEAISGHVVNGAAICPSSVFADMAFSAAKYIRQKAQPGKLVPAMSLENLNITHPLVVPAIIPNQTIEVTATASASTNWTVDLSFKSKDGVSTHDHGGCRVTFGDSKEWKAEWAKHAWFVKARMDALVGSARTGQAHQLLKPMVYKLFQHVVRYSERYQGLSEVFLDNKAGDTVAKIQLKSIDGAGTFTANPYWTDSIVHLAGFVLNGNTTTPDDTVYISGGLSSMRVAEELSIDKIYTSYVRMQPSSTKGYLVGDVYIFDGEEIIALCAGVMFQELKKNVLAAIIGHHTPGGPAKKDMSIMSKPQAIVSTRAKDTTPSEGPLFSSILRIIADEGRASINKMIDDATFGDLKIEQMKTIAITSKIREILLLDIPTSMFSEDVSIGDLRNYIQEEFGQDEDNTITSDSSEYGSGSTKDAYNSPPSSDGEDDESNMADILIEAVIKETGIDPDEIEGSSLWSDMGVDSLMSIAIIDAIKKQTGVMLQATFLTEFPTVADVKRELSKQEDEKITTKKFTPKSSSVVATKPKSSSKKHTPPPTPKVEEVKAAIVKETPAPEPKAAPAPKVPKAAPKAKAAPKVSPATEQSLVAEAPSGPKYSSNVVLLQGRPASGQKALFMIADGAGSATAYIHFPQFKNGVPVYALESPFLHCPKEYNCTIEEVAVMYKNAILKTQPEGPYMIGGWSAGAVYAYEVTRQLLEAGEKIDGLILLDMRVPRPMPDALEPNMELLEQAGLITGIKRAGRSLGGFSETLKQHLLSTVKALMLYDPLPMDPARRPAHSVMIWAKIGMSEVVGKGQTAIKEPEVEDDRNIMEDENTGLKAWFTAKRKVFGPNGWDKLLGDIECHAVDADHFSMVAQPQVKLTGAVMVDAVARMKAAADARTT